MNRIFGLDSAALAESCATTAMVKTKVADNPHDVFIPASAEQETIEQSADHTTAFGHNQPSHWATSFAQYVNTIDAPARVIAVSDSSTTAFSSIHPFSAAAFTIAYSPDTL